MKHGRLIDGDALKEYFFRPYSNEESYSNIDIGHIIDDQPTVNSSAQPEHNTGKWVRGTSHGLGVYNWTCKCGHVVVAKVPDRFCGACGCDNAERRTDE